MQKLGTFSLTLLLYACAGDQPVTFSGRITPQAGVCDAAAPAVLIKRGRYVQFTPREGILVLAGEEAAGGAVHARLQTIGADHKPYALSLDATHNGTAMDGQYITPRCRYAVSLRQEN